MFERVTLDLTNYVFKITINVGILCIHNQKLQRDSVAFLTSDVETQTREGIGIGFSGSGKQERGLVNIVSYLCCFSSYTAAVGSSVLLVFLLDRLKYRGQFE